MVPQKVSEIPRALDVALARFEAQVGRDRKSCAQDEDSDRGRQAVAALDAVLEAVDAVRGRLGVPPGPNDPGSNE